MSGTGREAQRRTEIAANHPVDVREAKYPALFAAEARVGLREVAACCGRSGQAWWLRGEHNAWAPKNVD